tara:strand:+ start:682 stop:990 length:309 start_codon:yes stop_codon:yes gene_type:complete
MSGYSILLISGPQASLAHPKESKKCLDVWPVGSDVHGVDSNGAEVIRPILYVLLAQDAESFHSITVAGVDEQPLTGFCIFQLENRRWAKQPPESLPKGAEKP